MEMLQAGRPDPVADARERRAVPRGARAVRRQGRYLARSASRARASRRRRACRDRRCGSRCGCTGRVTAPAIGGASARRAAPPTAPTAVDAEFLQIFIEEARENIARLQTCSRSGRQNPLDAEALRDVRRVFHTLKGSGRMVGARRVSEFSWSIESLLNRVISQTLARSPDIVDVVRDAVAALPRLVDELEDGERDPPTEREPERAPTHCPDARPPRCRAATPAAPVGGRAEPPQAAVAAVEVAAVEPPGAPPGMDPVLHDIFRKETAGHVAVVRDFIERCGQAVAPYAVTEALHRACHTLSGIAKTAGVRQGIKVAEPMEHYVRKLHDNGYGLPAGELELLRDTVHSLENVVEHVEEDTGFFPDHGRLVAGWHALERALDAELAHLTEAGERTIADAWRPEGRRRAPRPQSRTKPCPMQCPKRCSRRSSRTHPQGLRRSRPRSWPRRRPVTPRSSCSRKRN